MKKLFFAILMLVTAIALFSACKTGGDDTKPTNVPAVTDAPATATPVSTATPTPSPEPTATPTPSPEPEPGTFDLFAASGIGDPMTADADGMIIGNSWPDDTGRDDICWGGLLEAGTDTLAEPPTREVVEETLSNGETGYVLRFADDSAESDGTGYLGAGNYICNAGYLLQPGHTYKLTVVVKASHSQKFIKGETTAEIRDYYIFCNAAEGAAWGVYPGIVKVEPTGEWQTVEYTFTTGSTIPDKTYFTICCDPSSPFMWYGFEVLIESVTLYEVVS
ncbi:MAG: carbohydrate binding domain-containing protein [Clostridia bacterium]|nr:carbohydrate binding domain-containing protein [Clostridia bacterium]